MRDIITKMSQKPATEDSKWVKSRQKSFNELTGKINFQKNSPRQGRFNVRHYGAMRPLDKSSKSIVLWCIDRKSKCLHGLKRQS